MKPGIITRIKAKLANAPAFIKEHWAQYYPQCGYEFLRDNSFLVIMFDSRASVGDVVPVLTKNGCTYYYKITRISHAAGDDWGIYSSAQYDLLFHHVSKTEWVNATTLPCSGFLVTFQSVNNTWIDYVHSLPAGMRNESTYWKFHPRPKK